MIIHLLKSVMTDNYSGSLMLRYHLSCSPWICI